MEKFVINGGKPLRGTITPAGNKNAVLPLMAACLLTSEPVILHNVPDIADVKIMLRLLQSLGVQIRYLNQPSSVELYAKDILRYYWQVL